MHLDEAKKLDRSPFFLASYRMRLLQIVVLECQIASGGVVTRVRGQHDRAKILFVVHAVRD